MILKLYYNFKENDKRKRKWEGAEINLSRCEYVGPRCVGRFAKRRGDSHQLLLSIKDKPSPSGKSSHRCAILWS